MSLSKIFKTLLVLNSILNFFTLNSSTETNSGIQHKVCRSCCLITPLYLTLYFILASSSAVTNLPNKTLIFHDFQGPKIEFHDFPGLENEILKSHDFPGFP